MISVDSVGSAAGAVCSGCDEAKEDRSGNFDEAEDATSVQFCGAILSLFACFAPEAWSYTRQVCVVFEKIQARRVRSTRVNTRT